MEAPVDSLFRTAHRALTVLGGVVVSAIAPVAALVALALLAQSEAGRAPLLADASENAGAGRTLTAAAQD